jgi:hypothetical protein
MRSHIRNYEKPDGWSKGQPEVLVAKNVVKKLGEPAVNYESLHQFITDDIGVPYDDKTVIKLYGRAKYSMVHGYTFPYTRTVHVNPIAAEEIHAHRGGTMRTVAHELRHRGDGTNRKMVTAVETAARLATYRVGYDVAQYLPILAGAPLLGAFATKQAWYAIEPPEIRARKQERAIETSPHQTDILFPRTQRAMLMAATGGLPDITTGSFDKLLELNTLAQRAGVTVVMHDEAGEHVIRANTPQAPFDQERQ